MYLCCNASGSEKLPPSVISSPNQMHRDGFPVNLIESSTGKISSQCFKTWLCSFSGYINQNRRALLILDPTFHQVCSTIPTAELYPNIEFKFLPQFHYNHVQPFNFGIMSCFKSFYRSGLIGEVIGQKEYPTEEDFSSMLISERHAHRLINDSWTQVSSSVIQSAWNASELLPSSHAFDIPPEYLNLPDPLYMVLSAYPYLYSIIRNYDEVDQIHLDNDGQFPTEFEALVVEEVVASYLESNPTQEIKLEHQSDCYEIKPDFTLSADTNSDAHGDSKNFINLSLKDISYIENLTSLDQFPGFREPVSCTVQANCSSAVDTVNCFQSNSSVISPELTAPYFVDIDGLSVYPNLPSTDQIQNVDMLLQLLKSHLNSGFGAPSDITAALDFVSQYVHQFDGTS